MTGTWTTLAGSDFDRADQNVPVHECDRDIGLDTTTLHAPPEAMRAALDPAEFTDRIDQAWTTPLDLEDDYGPRSPITDTANHFLQTSHIHTAATDPDNSPVVHWPEPSPLEPWWNTIMRPARPM
ncbi:hypothetical protein [Nocardia terpenica]|uniref:Uncharacterized protein n=1 Tax=Nocardia terpenica TaxID=455432 RepID=A0A6G9Z6Z1_9NOCA|nr:hypothetical protein [Nocardia terpenica]QIS21369.1 hypothetical protein F6W96_26580 [Nocardia terpenica]